MQLKHLNDLKIELKERSSVFKKLLLGYSPLTFNFKFIGKSKKTIGSPHITHGEPYRTTDTVVSKVLINSSSTNK